MGYSNTVDKTISEKNILEFYLSHRTNPDFKYKPTKKTSKLIWKYLFSANLFEKLEETDLEKQEEILLIESDKIAYKDTPKEFINEFIFSITYNLER